VGRFVATTASRVLIGAAVVAALLAPATTLISEQGLRSNLPTLGAC